NNERIAIATRLHRHPHLPDRCTGQSPELVVAGVPVVEVTDDRNAARARSLNGEMHVRAVPAKAELRNSVHDGDRCSRNREKTTRPAKRLSAELRQGDGEEAALRSIQGSLRRIRRALRRGGLLLLLL